jgi:hypothetical protein
MSFKSSTRAGFGLVALLAVACGSSDEDVGSGADGVGGGAEVGGAPTASGGSATGGTATGGTGGTATGGTATGGTGGTETGGTGGSATGGTGGAETGGTGGTATGGTGGTATGGTATGGTGGSATGGTGGTATGGTGGTATGGTGGIATGGTGGGSSTDPYACDGSTSGYTTVMTKSGSTWTVMKGSQSVHSGNDMEAALRAAYGSLTAGRTSKQSILVQGSGDISASSQVGIPSYTVLNVCGTLNVSGTPSGSDRSPLYARNARDIEIPNLKMTGSPQYGIFFRGTNNMHLGNIDLRLTGSAGIGVRVDTSGKASTDTTFVQNLQIDYIYGSGMGSHIVETYGVDGVSIGTVEGDDVGECGVLLNRSINATVDLVDCTDCAVGTGYAAFRMANNNGVINGGYGTVNIIAKKVIARGGGRGVFSVSGSGAARIDHVDLEDTGNNSILLENAHNVTVGNTSQQSRIANSGQLRIAGTSSDIRIQNIALSGTSAAENPCATNSTWSNVNGAPTNCN